MTLHGSLWVQIVYVGTSRGGSTSFFREDFVFGVIVYEIYNSWHDLRDTLLWFFLFLLLKDERESKFRSLKTDEFDMYGVKIFVVLWVSITGLNYGIYRCSFLYVCVVFLICVPNKFIIIIWKYVFCTYPYNKPL